MAKIFRNTLCLMGVLMLAGCTSDNPLYEQIFRKIAGRSTLAGCLDYPSDDSTTAFTAGAETVAYWAFNEKDGRNVPDLSGHGHTLHLTGTFSWGDCRYGTGVEFVKGSGSTPFSLDFYPAAITVEAIVSIDRMPPENLDIVSHMVIVSTYSGDSTGEYGYELRINRDGFVDFVIATGATKRWVAAISRQPIKVGSLYHIAGTYDGAKIKLFINGVCVGETPHTGPLAPPADKAPLLIATRWYFRFYGVIDEVRISRSPLY